MRARIVFKHPAFESISDDQYWRLVVDGVQQTASKELGWQAYNKREFGSVQSLLHTFSFMLDTVDKRPLSEELVKEFHFQLFQVSSIFREQLTAGDYHAPQGGGRRGVFNVFRADNFTPKGLQFLRQKETEGLLRVIEKGTYGFPSMMQMKFHNPPALSAEIKRIIANYHSQLDKIKAEEKEKINQSARLSNIVGCVQSLELLHPFADGNGRVFCTITLNKLLLENGFSPVILADPNRFDGYAPEEMVEEVLRGIESFKNIPTIQPSTDDIIQQQVQADYFANDKESSGGKSKKTVLEIGEDPLHWAIAVGLPGLFRKMLTIGMKEGIDLNAKNNDGKTILMLAAACGEMDIVKELLALPGIDVHVQDQWGYTAAMWAAEAGHHDIMQLLSKDKPKLETKLGMTANQICKIKQEEKAQLSARSHYLFRCCNAFANMAGSYFNKYRELPLSHHYVSRDDQVLLQTIAHIMNTSQPEKLDPSQLMHLYLALLKLKCLIPGKHVLLLEVRQKIEKIDFKKASSKCKEDLASIDFSQFEDFPNYQALKEFSSKAEIVYFFKDTNSLFQSVIENIASFLGSQDKAIDFLFSTPELATVLFHDVHTPNRFINELGRDKFLSNLRDYPAYQERLFHYLLASSEAVSHIDLDLLLGIGKIFEEKPQLQGKLLNVILKNTESRKNCIQNKEALFNAFPNHKEQLVALLEIEKISEERTGVRSALSCFCA